MSKSFDLFRIQGKLISNKYPKLSYLESQTGFPSIIWELVLENGDSELIDSYFIRIEPTDAYPLKFPKVFETGGRIPINIDWHVFPSGHCCIKSLPEEDIICNKGIDLFEFIEQQVKPYFFNQKFREIHGYFMHERSHGLDGNIEFFEDIFKTKNLKIIAKGLLFIKERKAPSRVSKCFCGSGSKYRKCHRNAYNLLNLYTNDQLELYTNMILSSPRYI